MIPQLVLLGHAKSGSPRSVGMYRCHLHAHVDNSLTSITVVWTFGVVVRWCSQLKVGWVERSETQRFMINPWKGVGFRRKLSANIAMNNYRTHYSFG